VDIETMSTGSAKCGHRDDEHRHEAITVIRDHQRSSERQPEAFREAITCKVERGDDENR
jgi:hypothetical protein